MAFSERSTGADQNRDRSRIARLKMADLRDLMIAHKDQVTSDSSYSYLIAKQHKIRTERPVFSYK
jgi:hypothetical protein